MARKPIHEKIGVSRAVLSRKIRLIRREQPGISQRAAVGKAAGKLAHERGREFKPTPKRRRRSSHRPAARRLAS